MRRLWSLTLLDLKRTIRNVRYLVFAVAMPIGFYLLYSNMFGRLHRFDGTVWGAYFLVSMATFGAIGTTLNITGTQVAVERGQGWQRFLRLTPLRGTDYVLSKLATAWVAALVETAAVTAVAAASGLSMTQTPILPAIAAVWVGSLAFSAIGLFLGQVLDAASVTYGVTVIYLALGFLGGLWTPLQVLPPVFTHIAAWMPSYRVAELGWDVLTRSTPGIGAYAILAAYAVLFGVMGGTWFARREARRP